MEIKTLSQVVLTDTDLVLVDLDNTLYSYDRCHEHAKQLLIDECVKRFSISHEKISSLFVEARQKVHINLHGTAASHSRLFYCQDMVEKITGKTDGKTILELYNIYWDNFLNVIELLPESLQFLETCKANNIITVLVTDMTAEIQFRKLDTLGIADYFSYIVTSEEAGIEKPHPHIFELAISKARRIKNNIEKIVVVGDDVKKDHHLSDIYEIQIYHVLG